MRHFYLSGPYLSALRNNREVDAQTALLECRGGAQEQKQIVRNEQFVLPRVARVGKLQLPRCRLAVSCPILLPPKESAHKMESNFIKERVTIKEELIKKNLKSSDNAKKQPSAGTSYDNPPQRVVVLEELINEGLRQDLVDLSKQVDQTCEIIADYIKVRSALKVFKQDPYDISILTNIGCNFYAHCKVDDATRIYLCIGQDYFLHMELDEALKMIDFKEKQLMERLDRLQEKASAIKAYIRIALEAMGRVYEVDRDKLTSEET